MDADGDFDFMNGHHFYTGLQRAAGSAGWHAWVHFLGPPEQASGYRVKVTANNPQAVGKYVSFEGPVNGADTLGKHKFLREVVGLTFPDRVARSLLNRHTKTGKNVIGLTYTISKQVMG